MKHSIVLSVYLGGGMSDDLYGRTTPSLFSQSRGSPLRSHPALEQVVPAKLSTSPPTEDQPGSPARGRKFHSIFEIML